MKFTKSQITGATIVLAIILALALIRTYLI